MNNKRPKILVVDDDEKIVFAIQMILDGEGFHVLTATNGRQALDVVRGEAPDVTLLDVLMPEMNGLEILERIRSEGVDTCVVIMTGFGTMETAIRAMHLGAFDYVTKPLDVEKIKILCSRALEMQALRREVHDFKIHLHDQSERDTLVGNSPAIQEIYKVIGIITASSNDSSVLIQGESGTGKELVAKAIHVNSHHAGEPFVPVNCTALPETLLESELFGHERGAYTGAHERKIGRLELARKGTLFFDEIGDLSPNLQTKLLRLLQEREFERLGGNESLRIEARFIFATNRDLEKEVREGRFREDLYFRINVIPIRIPPLRERKVDISVLVDHFLAKHRTAGKSVRAVSREAMAALEAYDYPGNVRELSNLIERGIILSQGSLLTLEHLPETLFGRTRGSDTDLPITQLDYRQARRDVLATFERKYLAEILRIHNGNVAAAAEKAGIERQSFYRLLSKHGINPQQYLSPQR